MTYPPAVELWIWLVLMVGTPLVGATAAAVIRWRARRSIASQVRRTPLCAIGAITDNTRGPVAVHGTTRALATLHAPVATVPVIGFRLTIQFDDPGGREASSRPQSLDLSQIVEFDLVDATGTLRVMGHPVALLAAPREVDPATLAVTLTRPDVERLVQQQGFSVVDLVAGRNLRAVERLLLPDTEVYVLGQPRREIDSSGGGAGYRAPPTRLWLEAPRGTALIVADCQRDLLLQQIQRLAG